MAARTEACCMLQVSSTPVEKPHIRTLCPVPCSVNARNKKNIEANTTQDRTYTPQAKFSFFSTCPGLDFPESFDINIMKFKKIQQSGKNTSIAFSRTNRQAQKNQKAGVSFTFWEGFDSRSKSYRHSRAHEARTHGRGLMECLHCSRCLPIAWTQS